METGASNRSSRESDPDRIPSPESWSFESSRILPQVFEGLDTARKLSVLDSHGDVRFDICLLWDYANYPDDPALAEFLSALGNHVHENSRVFYTSGRTTARQPARIAAATRVDSLAIVCKPLHSAPSRRTWNY